MTDLARLVRRVSAYSSSSPRFCGSKNSTAAALEICKSVTTRAARFEIVGDAMKMCLLIFALLTALSCESRAAQTVTESFQKGLFEEEANHNLYAAIKAH